MTNAPAVIPATHLSRRRASVLLDLLLLGEGLSAVVLSMWGFIVSIPTTDALADGQRFILLVKAFSWLPDPELPVGLVAMAGGFMMAVSLTSRDTRWRFHERWIGRIICATSWFGLAVPVLLQAPHLATGWVCLMMAVPFIGAAHKEGRIGAVAAG